jgi:hypothetical protein
MRIISKRTVFAAGLCMAILTLTASTAYAAVSFGQSQCNFVTDSAVHAEQSVAKPGYLQSYKDPVFGGKVTRITGDPGAAMATGGTWGSISRAGYETRPVWNADQSLILLENVNGGNGGALFIDGNTYQPVVQKSLVGTDQRWHPTDPNLMLYVGNASSSSCEFGVWNVRTGQKTVQMTVPGYVNCTMSGTGNWSDDSKVAAVVSTRVSDGKLIAFAVNTATGQKYPDIDLIAKGINYTSDDAIYTSPLGDLIFISSAITGGAGTADNGIVLDLQGNQVGSRWLEYGLPSHVDLSVDVNGNEVVVGTAKSGSYPGRIVMRDMRTGAITPLDAGGYAIITSTRNKRLPGWAFVNHSGRFSALDAANHPPYNGEIFAVKLDGSNVVTRFVQSHNDFTDYDNQGFVGPSPDGMRFVFASSWGAGRPVQTYVVDLRDLCSSTSTPAPAPAPSGNLLSQGQVATASSYDVGITASMANDGNANTRWVAGTGTFPQYWQVDLGAQHDLSQIKITSTTNAYLQYRVDVSSDNVNFVLALDKTANTITGDYSKALNALGARYVRITITGATSGFWAGFYEAQIYGSSQNSVPTAKLAASATSLTQGQSSTLTWSSTASQSCTGSGFSTGGAASGSVKVTPASTTTYSVSCSGSGGTASASATVSVTPVVTTPVLLSGGKPASASSSSSGNAPSAANDGNVNSRWVAGSRNFPQSWKVDLGASHSLSSAKIVSTVNAYLQYRIEVSSDNVNFTTVVNKTSNTVKGDYHDNISANGRYVRITVTGATSGFWAAFYEAQIFGK